MIKKIIIGVFALILVIVAAGSIYVQKADSQSAIIRMSQLYKTVSEPGLHFKMPIIDTRVVLTKRVIEYDAPPLSVTTKDKKNIVFDIVSFSRITDPEKFYVKFKTIENAQQFFDDTVYAAVRNQVGTHTFDDVLFENRDRILANALKYTNDRVMQYGATVDIIQFKRVTLPKDNEDYIYRSMVAERRQISAQIKAEGDAKYVEIKSTADKEYIQTISDAKRRAAAIKAEGDQKAQAMIEEVNAKAPGLYLFMKNLEFYKNNLEGGTTIVTDTKSALLKDLLGK